MESTTHSSSRTSWEMADAAVKSFDGSQPLQPSQDAALLRWKEFKATWDSKHLCKEHLQEISKIFIDLFLLGELSEGKELEVDWKSSLPKSIRGLCHKPTPGLPNKILLNSDCQEIWHLAESTVGVLLHELAHALINGCKASRERREGAKPWWYQAVSQQGERSMSVNKEIGSGVSSAVPEEVDGSGLDIVNKEDGNASANLLEEDMDELHLAENGDLADKAPPLLLVRSWSSMMPI